MGPVGFLTPREGSTGSRLLTPMLSSREPHDRSNQ